MLLGIRKRVYSAESRKMSAYFRTQSVKSSLNRTDTTMKTMRREQWTETEIDELPQGEHDYFERKSGLLFSETGELLGKLAKTISAMANSGGGHIVLGVDDSGVPDGVPAFQGRTPTREWLEQKIPNLVAYPLACFRVHTVIRSPQSRIPSDREIYVIDIEDSTLAPHQCVHGGGDAKKYAYYFRQAGRSELAPHFYLELLRQRLISPALELSLVGMEPQDAYLHGGGTFLECKLNFNIANVGRVAAYKWALIVKRVENCPEREGTIYFIGTRNFPVSKVRSSSIRLDDTILPGCTMIENLDAGFMLLPSGNSQEALRVEIENVVCNVKFFCQLATETSPGEVKSIPLNAMIDPVSLIDFIKTKVPT